MPVAQLSLVLVLCSLHEWRRGTGRGAWYLSHISKLTLPDITTELNDTFDGAGRRLCITGGKKFQL